MAVRDLPLVIFIRDSVYPMNLISIIGGTVMVALGVLIFVFRERYAGWRNRVAERRGATANFTATFSIVYAAVAVAVGLYLLLALGLLQK
jgi:hypothetical protein